MRKEADHVLREVKEKQEDIKKMRELLGNLVILRKVRSQNAETKGIVATAEAEKVFQSLIGKFFMKIDTFYKSYNICDS